MLSAKSGILDSVTRSKIGKDEVMTPDSIEQKRLEETLAANAAKQATLDDEKDIDFSDPELKNSFNEITSSKSEINWALYGFGDMGTNNHLELFQKGSGGYRELYNLLKKTPGRLLWGILEVNAEDHDQDVSFPIKRPKYVYISYCGHSTPTEYSKMCHRLTNIVQRQFPGVHLHVHVRDISTDFAIKTLAKEVLRAHAAHKPTHINFGNKEVLSVDALEESDNDDD